MSYAAAVDHLFALSGELHTAPGATRHKFRLEDMHVLMSALGEPQLRFPSILVAGTNGKGSTCATMASILKAAGYRTGLYTSPHLSRVNERIQIDGEPIPDAKFAERYYRVDEAATALVSQGKLKDLPSFFERMTAIAFLTYAEEHVDLAVLEVGMGGRLDATNIVEPIVSVITDISLDHTEWLGSTITAIAHEKAGIMRRNGVLVTLPQHPEANQAIGEDATALNVRAVNAARYIPARQISTARNRYPIEVPISEALNGVLEVDSPLAGVHQQRNLALAIATMVEIRNSNGYKIDLPAIEAGIRTTRWPGRLERFAGNSLRAEILVDVAHNAAGTWALRSALSSLEEDEPGNMDRTLVFGCLRDKAVAEMAQILFPLFDRVILTQVDSPRAATLAEMELAASATGVPFETATDAHAALDAALRQTSPNGHIVVSGSIYLVGKIRDLIPSLDAEASPARTSA
ncbi:MAG TPA: folylpolyglutamate synthase/dihydrofolate synthase family protein [Acidisarcina sp.]|nr:folylpolyglutamate synthase/dihydrofolate synthase family protein [Acidisarcina sp.]